MECNKTFISIKQLEQQDISADKICSILFQLYDELAISPSSIEVNDIKAFRSHMNTLLDRILKLYKANEGELSKLALFQRIEAKEKEIEDYKEKINSLEEEIEQSDILNQKLLDQTKEYKSLKEKNDELTKENVELKERLKELSKIDLKILKDENNLILEEIKTIQTEYDHITEEILNNTKVLEQSVENYNELVKNNNITILKIEELEQQLSTLQQQKKQLEEEKTKYENQKQNLKTLKEIKTELESLQDVNNKLEDKISELEKIIGNNSEENYLQLQKLKDTQLEVLKLLKEYSINNNIKDIEEQLELEETNIFDYIEKMNQFIVATKQSMNQYYTIALEVRKIIAIENSTAREEDDE